MLKKLSMTENKSPLPPALHRAIVESLFADRQSMLVGVVGLSLSAAICFYKSYVPLHAVFSFLFLCIGLYRYVDSSIFHSAAKHGISQADIKNWENRYFLGTSVFAALLGGWGFTSLFEGNDQVVQIISIVSILVCLIGVNGRNFANKKLVDIQVHLIGIPLVMGFLSVGDPYYIYVAFGLIPFLIGLRTMATRQRNALFNALISQGETAKIADEFDAAITNMPLGLCMFSPDGHLIVSNPKMVSLFPAFEKFREQNITDSDLLRNCLQSEAVQFSEIGLILQAYDELRDLGSRGSLTIRLPRNRTFELDYQPKPDGGSVVIFIDTSKRVIAEREVKYMARSDVLTGLANRAYFLQRMEGFMDQREPDSNPAVMVLDLDRFKQVNDTLGHSIGDKVLQRVSKELKSVIGDNGVLCRFGGDEFVVLLLDPENQEFVAQIASNIVQAITAPSRIDNHHIEIGVSIGIAFASSKSCSPATLIQSADLALYTAKSSSDCRICFFEPEMQEHFNQRIRLEHDLRLAIKNNDLTVAYQPIVDTSTSRVTLCEALVRWSHPELGNISPMEFVQIAETTGMIEDLGNFVLETACQECAGWPADMRVAVNLSAVQLHSHNVVLSVRHALELTELSPNRLELEITETALLQDLESTCRILTELRKLGVTISLDDFGTGYSSLNYLHHLPIDKLKVDRSFISDITTNPDALVLCRGITRLAQELGLTVVLEGVETEEQLDVILAEFQNTLIQGYLFCKPLPSSMISNLLEAHWCRNTTNTGAENCIDTVQEISNDLYCLQENTSVFKIS